MKREVSPEGKGLKNSSSGDPQDDFEAALSHSVSQRPSILTTLERLDSETKRLLVLAAAATYGAYNIVKLTGNKRDRLKPFLHTATATAIASTAWAQYNRLQGNKPEVAEIDY